MAKMRSPKSELEVRLKTVEEKLEEIFGRIGLLDEQARQAGYHAYLAMVQLGQVRRMPQSSLSERGGEEVDKLETMEATLTRLDQRAGKMANKRTAHQSR